MRGLFQLQLAVLVVVGCFIPRCVSAEQPLHRRIDELIIAAAGDLPVAPSASDTEFLRRIFLDLAGRIPNREEVRVFLNDGSSEKRENLIDQLLAGADYPRHMSEQFHIMLMERLGNDENWTLFLRKSFEKNLAWDAMTQALLDADRNDEETRGATYFLTARLISEGAMADTDVPGLTRDVGRLLAGKDLQCAQCHDHLSIDDYKQSDFQGLHAIFLNIKQDRSVNFPAVTEGLMSKKHEFMSVFIQSPEQTGPRVPGMGEIELPKFAEGEEYVVPPDKKKRSPGVPKFSPLSVLAKNLTQVENKVFRENIVNRLWFLMLGRGLVHPLDEHHSANPPSHPQLLAELGQQFADHDFDIKWLLKQIALSETYQRTSLLSDGDQPQRRDKFVLTNQKRISAEQMLWSTLVATGELQNYQTASDASDEDKRVASERLNKLRGQFVEMFSNPPREPEVEFQPSVQGTLFALNNEQVQRLFERRDGNLIDHLMKLSDEKIADELFISILNRPPSEADQADVDEFLKQSPNREKALGQLSWALWSSNEFFINH